MGLQPLMDPRHIPELHSVLTREKPLQLATSQLKEPPVNCVKHPHIYKPLQLAISQLKEPPVNCVKHSHIYKLFDHMCSTNDPSARAFGQMFVHF